MKKTGESQHAKPIKTKPTLLSITVVCPFEMRLAGKRNEVAGKQIFQIQITESYCNQSSTPHVLGY